MARHDDSQPPTLTSVAPVGLTDIGRNRTSLRSVGDCHVDVKSKLGISIEAYIPRATVWWFLNLVPGSVFGRSDEDPLCRVDDHVFAIQVI